MLVIPDAAGTALVLFAWLHGGLSVGVNGAADRPSIAYEIDNLTGVPEPVLAAAAGAVATVFAKVGIDARLMAIRQGSGEAQAVPDGCHSVLRVIMLPEAPFAAMAGNSIVLGMTRLSGAPAFRISYLSFGRILATARSRGIPPGELLGHAIVHEMGHLLLPRYPVHTLNGIMRRPWVAAEYSALARGALAFTSEQGQLIRATLAARTARANVGLACAPPWGEPSGAILADASRRH